LSPLASVDPPTQTLAAEAHPLHQPSALAAKTTEGREAAMADTAGIVRSYLQAVESGDFARARGFLNDRFAFEGPFDSFDSPEPYLEAVKKLHPIVERMNIVKLFASGDEAAVLCEMTTKTPIGTVPIAEFHRLIGDKIAAIRVVFDARPFAAMFTK
jgi:hypothetical protein